MLSVNTPNGPVPYNDPYMVFVFNNLPKNSLICRLFIKYIAQRWLELYFHGNGRFKLKIQTQVSTT